VHDSKQIDKLDPNEKRTLARDYEIELMYAALDLIDDK